MDMGSKTKNEIRDAAYFKQLISDIKRRNYKMIGRGSGRVVFDLVNGTVAKVATNGRGLAQNEAEYKISLMDNSGLLAKIPGVSEKFGLLIMEKAESVRDLNVILNYFNVRSRSELYRTKKLNDLSDKYDLNMVDLMRPSSWGKINGKPVIIDYGLTVQVQRKYYTFL